MPKSILFVHQGYELYGSDRTLVQSVHAASMRWPEARITVLLPNDGVLRSVLQSLVDDVRIVDLGILRKANLKNMKFREGQTIIFREELYQKSIIIQLI